MKVAVVYDPMVQRAGEPNCWRLLFGETEVPQPSLSVAAFIADSDNGVENLVAKVKDITPEQAKNLSHFVEFAVSFLQGKLTNKEFLAQRDYII